MDLRYIKGASLLACLVSMDAVGSSLASVDLRADLRQSGCIYIVLYRRTVRYVTLYMYYVFSICTVIHIMLSSTSQNLTGRSSQPRHTINSPVARGTEEHGTTFTDCLRSSFPSVTASCSHD